MKSGVFNLSICNRNMSILVIMRSLSASNDVPMSRYDIFRYQWVRKMSGFSAHGRIIILYDQRKFQAIFADISMIVEHE